jgi:hypothetical protein
MTAAGCAAGGSDTDAGFLTTGSDSGASSVRCSAAFGGSEFWALAGCEVSGSGRGDCDCDEAVRRVSGLVFAPAGGAGAIGCMGESSKSKGAASVNPEAGPDSSSCHTPAITGARAKGTTGATDTGGRAAIPVRAPDAITRCR